MKRNTSIKLKAAFLLMVFALNTVVGFACSVGVDMGFNSKHHEENEATEAVVHIHKDGKKHVHHAKKERHSHNKTHKHDKGNDHQKPKSETGGCCNDKVLSFQHLDKSVPSPVSLVHPVFFTAFIATYYSFNIFPQTDVVRDIKPFVRSYHPPIPDIRIAIQSFQV
ncbi:MAG: hypothetical protein EOO06_13110 [Chitinophagaceae bacterium]|nr:MAG: hypothetical protein EOO06_13110 [Chitinophagaceae bacterium]